MIKEIYVSKSGIDGKGLFAGRAFEFNEVVYQPRGRVVHAEDIDWDAIGKKGYDEFLQVGAWEYFDGRSDPKFKYLNHSCDPNIGYKNLEGKVSFVAIKPISRGEEITFDYSTTMFEELDEEPMPCNCNSKNCRKVIADLRHLPRRIQRRYLSLGIAPPYVLGECTQKTPMIKKRSFRVNNTE